MKPQVRIFTRSVGLRFHVVLVDAVRKLGPSEELSANRAAYALYSQLWNNERVWTKIEKEFQAYVPDKLHSTNSTTVSPVTTAKAIWIDLTAVSDLKNIDMIKELVKPRFFVRDEYMELDLCVGDGDWHVLLLGQPGIGMCIKDHYS